jgi:hypothetical protein
MTTKIKTQQLGTKEEFHSQKCYENYLYSVKLASKINELLDSGHLVFENNESFTNRFVFRSIIGNEPCIGEITKSGNSMFTYFGNSFDKDGKVWFQKDENKSKILKRFQHFKMVRPENIEKINID